MKKHLLPEKGNFYKANLNCHTSLSDGTLTAQQLKQAYMNAGYSIVAFSDNCVLISHKQLADNDFLPILAYETEIYEDCGTVPKEFLKCYSLTLYSKDENNTELVDNSGQEYSQEYINKFISRANEKGFLVCLNHPAKSLQNYSDYDRLKGLFALEITDYNSFIEGHIEDPSHVYDRMLRYGGKRLHAMAADSNRNAYPFDDARSDSFGAYAMVKAENLEYATVISALENGDFYVSTGPQINEVYCENGKIHIKCSPVRTIRLLNDGRDGLIATAEKGKYLTEAVFDIDPAFLGKSARVDIRDGNGNFAETRAYFMDEIL